MSKYTALITALLCLSTFIGAHASASDLIHPYNITYRAKIEGFNVKAVRSLVKLPQAGEYKLVQNAKASMMRLNEKSTFRLRDNQPLETLSYHYERKVVGFNKEYRIDFANQATTAIYKEKKKKESLSKNNQTLFSLLSYQTEIQRRLLVGESNLELPIISKGRVRSYAFNIAGEEVLKTDLGNIDCIKIVRKRSRKQKTTTIWLAKNWQYSIMKIEHMEEGKVKYRLDIANGTVNGKTIK